MSAKGRILLLDPFSGIAGDMFLGALIDLGLSLETLQEGLGGLGVPFRLRAEKVLRGALSATKLHVLVRSATGDGWEEEKHAALHPEGSAEQDHGHAHHGHGRSAAEIQELIAASPLSEGVKRRAAKIFAVLAEAEGRVHGVPATDIHFHEVGAVDSIVDICGAALAVELMGLHRILACPVSVGRGLHAMEHGTMPLPAPATAEILKGMPVRFTAIDQELCTPTGAAILSVMVDEFVTAQFSGRVVGVGYGAGSHPRGNPPNVLRATLLGEPGEDAGVEVGEIVFDVDDMTGEALGAMRGRLEEAGALDVVIQPVQMKKNRPGWRVEVLVRPADLSDLTELVLVETSTLGVRSAVRRRQVLARRIETVETPLGPVRVKVASSGGKVVKRKPEYEDCLRLAETHGLPFEEVRRIIEHHLR